MLCCCQYPYKESNLDTQQDINVPLLVMVSPDNGSLRQGLNHLIITIIRRVAVEANQEGLIGISNFDST
jgi:hypothetical protein